MEGYITKNQAIHAMEQVTQPECFIENTRKDFAKIIKELPAADVAPVTYCKYCMRCLPHTDSSLFQYPNGEKTGNLDMIQHRTELVCSLHGMKVTPYFYCGDGKRWGEEND